MATMEHIEIKLGKRVVKLPYRRGYLFKISDEQRECIKNRYIDEVKLKLRKEKRDIKKRIKSYLTKNNEFDEKICKKMTQECFDKFLDKIDLNKKNEK